MGFLAVSACGTLKAQTSAQATELEIREIAPPVELPRSCFGWFLAGGVATLGLVGGAVHWYRRRTLDDARSPKSSAPDLALQALDQLLAEDCLEQREVKEFYQRVTDILRHYLERQFGLRAPELTTREFLAALGTDGNLHPNHKELLEAFLTHCDLVKFAEHQPSPEDIRNVFACCQSFILETRHAV